MTLSEFKTTISDQPFFSDVHRMWVRLYSSDYSYYGVDFIVAENTRTYVDELDEETFPFWVSIYNRFQRNNNSQ